MTATGFPGQASVLALLTGGTDGQTASGTPDRPPVTVMTPRSSGFAHHLAALAPDVVNGAGRDQGAIDENPRGPKMSEGLARSGWGTAEKLNSQGETRATPIPDDAPRGPLRHDLPGLDRAQDRVPRHRGGAWTRLGEIVARSADGADHPPPSAPQSLPSEPLELPAQSPIPDAPGPNGAPSAPQLAFPARTLDAVTTPGADPAVVTRRAVQAGLRPRLGLS